MMLLHNHGVNLDDGAGVRSLLGRRNGRLGALLRLDELDEFLQTFKSQFTKNFKRE